MSLQQLVQHFNDRFAFEHHADFHPFLLEKGLVSGIFGPIRISSIFTPVWQTDNYEQLIGHITQLSVTPYDNILSNEESAEFDSLFTNVITQPTDFQSIISLDRLRRTVHMLNYLAYAGNGGVLFLDVDPRHILGVQQNHGAYFEEFITQCGLATKNVVISMTVNNFYVLHHAQLVEGLSNYRQRGYQIALNIGSLYATDGLRELIDKLAPNYLRISAPTREAIRELSAIWQSAIKTLVKSQKLNGGQTIVQQVEHKEQSNIATIANIELVQGGYYDRLATDHLRCL